MFGRVEERVRARTAHRRCGEGDTVASEGYHEPLEWLDADAIELHRAVQSVIEELEAADWYNQRVTATRDEDLRAILAHNRDEEKEHAAMALEWWRRRDPVLDRHLRTYLFTDAPITELERDDES
jgi:ferritin-like protein